MKHHLIIVLAGACLLPMAGASAAGVEPGAPLAPKDAAGAWTLESGGRSLCVLKLSDQKAGKGGFAVQVPATCGDTLPAHVIGWSPTSDGMTLIGPDGQALIAFNRWSDSLFVSHRSSGVDVQLRRGADTTP